VRCSILIARQEGFRRKYGASTAEAPSGRRLCGRIDVEETLILDTKSSREKVLVPTGEESGEVEEIHESPPTYSAGEPISLLSACQGSNRRSIAYGVYYDDYLENVVPVFGVPLGILTHCVIAVDHAKNVSVPVRLDDERSEVVMSSLIASSAFAASNTIYACS
jgi:hypothetical protein